MSKEDGALSGETIKPPNRSTQHTHFKNIVAPFVAVDLPCHGQNGTRLARSWRPIEEQVGQPVLLNEALDCGVDEALRCQPPTWVYRLPRIMRLSLHPTYLWL